MKKKILLTIILAFILIFTSGCNVNYTLKYEDDTYATPTLYFVKDDSQRTLTGIVFEDLTTVDSGSRIKTGNGILDTDKGEVGIYGATVKLIEITGSENVVRDTKTTLADNPDTDENELGTFEFSGFLPGNYMIEYHYGDTVKTALLGQSGDIKVNKQSYNGSDYQATNNTGKKGEELVEGLYALNPVELIEKGILASAKAYVQWEINTYTITYVVDGEEEVVITLTYEFYVDKAALTEAVAAAKAGETVTVDSLIEKGLVKKALDGVKVLGHGEISKALTVQANAFSESAKQKIEAAGGKTEVI